MSPGVGGIDQLVDCTSEDQRVEEVGEIAHGLAVVSLTLSLSLSSHSHLEMREEEVLGIT